MIIDRSVDKFPKVIFKDDFYLLKENSFDIEKTINFLNDNETEVCFILIFPLFF